MSYPKMNDISTAFALCSCMSNCTRMCQVCSSPAWKGGPCVRELFWDTVSKGQQVGLQVGMGYACKGKPTFEVKVVPDPEPKRQVIIDTVDGPRYLGILKDVLAQENGFIATVEAYPGTVSYSKVEVHPDDIEVSPESLGDKAIRFIEEGIGIELVPWQRHIIKQVMDYCEGNTDGRVQ